MTEVEDEKEKCQYCVFCKLFCKFLIESHHKISHDQEISEYKQDLERFFVKFEGETFCGLHCEVCVKDIQIILKQCVWNIFHHCKIFSMTIIQY